MTATTGPNVYVRESPTHGARTFAVLGTRPWRCADGRLTAVADWHGICARCGAPFVQVAPVRASPSRSRKFGTVHCPDHRRHTTDSARRRNAELLVLYGLVARGPR